MNSKFFLERFKTWLSRKLAPIIDSHPQLPSSSRTQPSHRAPFHQTRKNTALSYHYRRMPSSTSASPLSPQYSGYQRRKQCPHICHSEKRRLFTTLKSTERDLSAKWVITRQKSIVGWLLPRKRLRRSIFVAFAAPNWRESLWVSDTCEIGNKLKLSFLIEINYLNFLDGPVHADGAGT